MKKMSILVLLLQYCAVVSPAVITQKNKLYLENQYGAPISCKVFNNNTQDNDRLRSNKETLINNQNRVLLGLIPHAKNAANRMQYVTDINIATTRYMSAGYTSLNGYLEALSNAINTCCSGMLVPQNARQYCNTNGVCNKDAIIVIYPSNFASGWNIDIQWRDPGRTVTSW